MRILIIFISIIFFACQPKVSDKLPIIGRLTVENGDTTYHTIRSFEFINQDSQIINNQILSKNVYVADFFFTHCPTICPKVTSQMLRIHDQFIKNDEVKLISFSLDPKRDTIGRLNDYATRLGVSSQKWDFLHGDKSEIYDLAEDYFSIALNDDEAPGGINHSGKLILVDKKGRVRSYCEGTVEEDVTKFMKDIELLLDKN